MNLVRLMMTSSSKLPGGGYRFKIIGGIRSFDYMRCCRGRRLGEEGQGGDLLHVGRDVTMMRVWIMMLT
jgi:hypothetical protein